MRTVVYLLNSGVALMVGLLVFLGNLSRVRHLEKCAILEGGTIGQVPCYMNADIFFLFTGLLFIVLGAVGCYYSIRETYWDDKK